MQFYFAAKFPIIQDFYPRNRYFCKKISQQKENFQQTEIEGV